LGKIYAFNVPVFRKDAILLLKNIVDVKDILNFLTVAKTAPPIEQNGLEQWAKTRFPRISLPENPQTRI